MKKRLLKSKCLFLFICRPCLSFISFFLIFILLLIASPAAFGQNIVKGHISSGNIALVGVTVQVKGTSISTQTDNNGDFSISAAGDATLSLSSIGYNTLEIQVENRSRINVQLQPSVKEMQQIVVVGYGTQKKQNVTSAVSTVNSRELAQSPSANISNMLVGRVSGITAIQDQGAPGADQSRIYVRGISTTGNIDPLYVIDGIPRTSEDFQRLSSDEIESVSVLKDAAAAAVYGARGANGVILITTKRGSLGKTSFEYSFNYGLQQATRLPNYVNSYRYARLYNAALENEGRPAVFSDEDLSKFQDGSDPIFHPDTRWLDILGLGTLQKHNLTVNGGVEKVRYFLSFSYLNQKSLFNQQNSDLGFKRYNFRSNIDVQATATTKIALDVSGYLGMRTEPGSGYGFVFENINRDAPSMLVSIPMVYTARVILPVTVGRLLLKVVTRNMGAMPC